MDSKADSGQNKFRSTDSPNENPAVDERAPGWKLPVDNEGRPDYEDTVEQIGLERGKLFAIGTEYYRYQGRENDAIRVTPQSEYADLKEDALAIPFVWAAYCEGRVAHDTPTSGAGMIKGVGNQQGNSHIRIEPGNSEDTFTRILPKGVPDRGAIFLDYWHGDDLPELALYDGTDREEPAFKFLLPTDDHPHVQLVRDRTSYLLESLPDKIEERLEIEL